MSDHRIIFETPNAEYRIVEMPYEHMEFEDLCGDTFTPECHPEIDPAQIEREKLEFQREENV